MFADPTTHTQADYQGWAPAVEWSDFGRLDKAGFDDCVASGCYTDVVRFAESSLGEEGIFQLKSYAKGVGEVRTGWRGEAESREELELKSTAVWRGSKLARIRSMALELERRAYRISPQVYAETEPMQSVPEMAEDAGPRPRQTLGCVKRSGDSPGSSRPAIKD